MIADDFILTNHAREQMEYRSIPEAWVWDALAMPDEIICSGENRQVIQKIVMENGKPYLLRIVAERETTPFEVVTVYKTSKIEKYRSVQ